VPILKDITYLSLRISMAISRETYATLRSLLASMSAVTHLDVLDSFFTSWIRANHHADVDGPVLFPNLHTIYVDRIMIFAQDPQPEEVHNMVRFLRRRIAHRRPVSVVHSHTKPSSVEKLWSMFFEILGLRITWNDSTEDGKLVGHTFLCRRK